MLSVGKGPEGREKFKLTPQAASPSMQVGQVQRDGDLGRACRVHVAEGSTRVIGTSLVETTANDQRDDPDVAGVANDEVRASQGTREGQGTPRPSEDDTRKEQTQPQDEASTSRALPVVANGNFRGYEIIGEVKGKSVTACIDSGATANYMSSELATILGISTTGPYTDVALADESTRKTLGRCMGVDFRSGKARFKIDFDVFPGLGYDLLLGVPWLVAEQPVIDFRRGTVKVVRGQEELHLPTGTQPPEFRDCGSIPATIQLMSPARFAKAMKTEGARPHLLVVRDSKAPIDSYSLEKGYLEDDADEILKEELPTEVARVIRKYREVFAKDVPPGVPPVRKGHEMQIDLEPDTRPISRPIYTLSPAELEEVKRQIDYLLRMGFIRPSRSP